MAGLQVGPPASQETLQSLTCPPDRRAAYHSDPQPHLSGGAGPQEDGRANQRSAYCKELLTRGGVEFSFEELRAERVNQRKQQLLDEELSCLSRVKEQLSQELQEKMKLLLLRTSQQVPPEGPAPQVRESGPATAPLHVFDESQAAAAARPAGNQLLDEVFLRPHETGPGLNIQCPQPDRQGDPRTTGVCHSAAPASRAKLSPVQETSVEASSLTSLGGCSSVPEDQDTDPDPDPDPSPAGSLVDPCEPDLRRQLLDRCDVTSSPEVHSEPRPLPAVREDDHLLLGGELHHVHSRVLDGGTFSVYKGATGDDHVLLKVDSCRVPWDFHQFTRLKTSSADTLPPISCFSFLDGCITVYTTPTDRMFTELTELVTDDTSAVHGAVAMLQLVLQLQSCRLLHAALRPDVLTCSHRGSYRDLLRPGWVFPVDWSSSIDLDLQQDVTSVQHVPAAQSYIALGLLEPEAPPELVDLVGVAETVHLLLTNSRMVAVKDAEGWTAEKFSGDEPCDVPSKMWRRFFRLLLNAGGSSPSSVLVELKEQLAALYL